MAYLKSELQNQKWLEGQVEVDQFIDENNISDDAMIYQMNFDKKVFKDEVEVRDYLNSHYYYSDDITETDTEFVANVINPMQMDMSTSVSIPLRRGLTVLAADLLYSPSMYDFDGKELKALDLREIMLTTGNTLPTVIEVAKVVSGEHPNYGKVEITKDTLKSMLVNFDGKVTGTDLAVNEDHKKNEAFGWFKSLFLNEGGDVLLAVVDWNAKGTKALSEKEYRYFSPEFRFNYVHPHSGKEYGPTLLGGALTNYPFLKMNAITELNEKPQTKGKTMPTEKEVELSAKNTELSGKVVELSNKNADLEKEVQALKDAAALEKRKAANLILFNEKKINKAQMDALNEGKSAYEVIALSETFNPEAKGADKKDGKGDEVNLSEEEKKLAKKLGMTDEEFAAGTTY